MYQLETSRSIEIIPAVVWKNQLVEASCESSGIDLPVE